VVVELTEEVEVVVELDEAADPDPPLHAASTTPAVTIAISTSAVRYFVTRPSFVTTHWGGCAVVR
jgi:hypothetical protein